MCQQWLPGPPKEWYPYRGLRISLCCWVVWQSEEAVRYPWWEKARIIGFMHSLHLCYHGQSLHEPNINHWDSEERGQLKFIGLSFCVPSCQESPLHMFFCECQCPCTYYLPRPPHLLYSSFIFLRPWWTKQDFWLCPNVSIYNYASSHLSFHRKWKVNIKLTSLCTGQISLHRCHSGPLLSRTVTGSNPFMASSNTYCISPGRYQAYQSGIRSHPWGHQCHH